MTNKNPIEIALLPLKTEAAKRAEIDSKNVIERISTELLAANNNLDIIAPKANSLRQNRNDYIITNEKRKFYRSLMKARQTSTRINEPLICDMDEHACLRFIEESIRNAEFEYDKFVTKMVRKIGDIKTASLFGEHIWGYSILTVTFEDNRQEKWRTQQIVNVSKLGKLFNQWPSRKIKQ